MLLPSRPRLLLLIKPLTFLVVVATLVLQGCREPRVEDSVSTADAVQKEIANSLLIDVTQEAGIDFVHDAVRNGDFLFPEINGAGCGFLDYDNDGNLDIYLVQSGRDLSSPNAAGKTNRLYRNRGDGTFEDVTDRSGAGDAGYGQGLACGDYNNDGYVDIYVANVGGPSTLLHNNGDGTFTDVTETAGVANGNWVITPSFLDYDNDGLLDLFATNYVDWSVEKNVVGSASNGRPDYTGPRSFSAMPAILYRNNGDGTFRDVTKEAGIDAAFGAGMGIVCADFNDDHLVDIFVANDSWANQLWINQGDATFQDVALESGCALSATGLGQANMGTNAEDLDGDGKLDLFTTNYHAQGSILYLQGSQGIFMDVSKRVGLFGPTAARTGFGACFFDLFNDGSTCVYIGNGAAVAGGELDSEDSTYAQKDMVLHWLSRAKKFEDITERIGPVMNVALTTRGVAVGDYDNDGAVDLLINNNHGPARLLRNRGADGQHWLMIRCLSSNGLSDAVGAKIIVTAGGKTRRRDVVINYSYASSCDPRIHFGLGNHSAADRVVVYWPDGAKRTWENVKADQVFIANHPAQD